MILLLLCEQTPFIQASAPVISPRTVYHKLPLPRRRARERMKKDPITSYPTLHKCCFSFPCSPYSSIQHIPMLALLPLGCWLCVLADRLDFMLHSCNGYWTSILCRHPQAETREQVERSTCVYLEPLAISHREEMFSLCVLQVQYVVSVCVHVVLW